MGKVLVVNYEFDASAQQVKFLDYTTIRLESVLLITNITDNIIIYNFADPNKGGTAGGKTLQLTYSTTSMDNSDELQIFYQETADDAAALGGDVVRDLSSSHLLGHIYQELQKICVQLEHITGEDVTEADVTDEL